LCRGQFKCDGTRSETTFRLSAKRTSIFKSAGASVQSTAGSRGGPISGSNAGYTMFRGSVKSTGYPLHSPVSPSLPLPCVTVCHHISNGVYSYGRNVAYTYLLLDLILLILLIRSKEHDASHYTELSNRLSLTPFPVQKFSTAPRSQTPCTSILPLMRHQMGTSFLNTLRSVSCQRERILQSSSVMQIAWTQHTHIRPHVTSSNYIVLQPIALRFYNKTTRMSERDQRNDEVQLQFWSRGNNSV
jgi:hypothetical protein